MSPAPYLSDIPDCQVSSTTYELAPLTPGAHPFILLPETKTGVQSPSGFPTLKTATFTPTYVHAKVNVSKFHFFLLGCASSLIVFQHIHSDRLFV